MEQTWGEAFSRVWGVFTGVFNQGSASFWRMIFWVILLGGSLYAVWNYRNMLVLSEEKIFKSQQPPINVESDRKRLNAMFREVQEASNHRSSSARTVQEMRREGRYAFNDPDVERQIKQAAAQSGTSAEVVAAAAKAAQQAQEEALIVPPPAIKVKAIMTFGRTRKAVMDIEGSGQGLIVQAGNRFQGQKGRIVRIDNDKVVVRWEGRDWNIAPEF